jgi:hypothetical protein
MPCPTTERMIATAACRESQHFDEEPPYPRRHLEDHPTKEIMIYKEAHEYKKVMFMFII